MALVLLPAFCLLSGAYAQQWSMRFAPGRLAGWVGSCVTIPCSFTYPAGWKVRAVTWTWEGNQTVYHSDKARVHAAFKGRARYLGNLQHNCSLRVVGLRPSDQGTYHFRFYAVDDGKNYSRMSSRGQQLNVSAHSCQPSLGRRTEPGPNLTCSVGAKCPHRPSWYDRDGARWSPGKTSGVIGATKLQISQSQLAPGAALRCQLDGYRDECDSDQSQPLGTVSPNVPRIEVWWLAGKTALREGDSFALRCQAAALRPIARYVWSRGDVWLPEAGQDLRVDKAAVSDGGSYACGVWVSGPGWGYLNLSARESVEVQLPNASNQMSGAPTAIIGPTVVIVLLLLVGLVGVIAWRKMRSKRQGMSSNPHPPGPGETPMSDRIYENTQHHGMGKPDHVRRMSPRRDHRGVPGLSGRHQAIPHLQPADEHGQSTAGLCGSEAARPSAQEEGALPGRNSNQTRRLMVTPGQPRRWGAEERAKGWSVPAMTQSNINRRRERN